MNLFDLAAKITLDTGEFERGIASVVDKGKSVAGTIKNGLGAAAKVTGIAIGAAATGVATLTKNIVDSYGEYEQLVGGVDKLFGEASGKLQAYAAEAYKTSGVSANEYMQQATSFSAALINSLGGDTEKAAELADVAMRSMSDNWNTFGTEVGAVQNAYQGFAKQNYTMLDNLKLGYGGTKEEMQRLIDDANEYAASIGEASDLSIDSFADIVQAIDLVQQKQNIAGTTSKEAATTIQGSIGMMKAAWQNLVTGMGDSEADLNTLVTNLVDSVSSVASNLIPVVDTALNSIGALIQSVAPMIAEHLPTLIATLAPQLLEAAGQIVIALGQGIMATAPTLLDSAIDLILRFADYLADNADSIVDGAVTMMITLVDTLVANAPQLVNAAIRILSSFVSAIIRNAPRIFEAAKNAIKNVLTGVFGVDEDTADSFIGTIESVFDAVGEIIDSIKEAIGTISDAIGPVSIEWSEIWDGISAAISIAGDAISTVITAIGEGIAALIGWFQDVGEEAQTEGTLINSIWESIQSAFTFVITLIQTAWDSFVAWVQEKIDAIVSAFTWLKDQMDTEGSAINLIWQNIQLAIDNVVTTITGIFDALTALLNGDFAGAWEAIKNTIGDVWENIKTMVTNAITIVQDTLNGVMDSIKTAISDKWNAIKDGIANKVDSIKTNLSNKWDTIKTNVTNKMDTIKTNIANKWDTIKTNVGDKVESIKTNIANKFDTVKNTVRDKFDAIKNAISDKLTAARDKVHDLIESIKSKFNFTWSLPHLKLPHPYISGSFSLNPPSVPSFGISWYKKAYDQPFLFDKPTVFPGFGDGVGSEMVYGKDSLMRDIREAVRSERDVQPITINVYATKEQDERQIAAEVQKALTNLMARQRAGAIA